MGASNWKILTILSGKGGVGKTTIASALGYSFAQMGFKTLLIDLDVGLRNLDLQFQIQTDIVFDLEHVLKDVVSLDQALIAPSYTENLFVLTSSLSRDIESIPTERFHKFLSHAREMFEIVLIDSPAGVSPYMLNLVAPTDKYLLISQPFAASLRSIDKLLGLLQHLPSQDIHWLINRYNRQAHCLDTISSLESQLNFKRTFVMEDLSEITLASLEDKYISRQNTPQIIHRTIELAQILLSKTNQVNQDIKRLSPHQRSWWAKWFKWGEQSQQSTASRN